MNKKIRINKDFLEYIRLDVSGTIFFSDMKREIVPKEDTHRYLFEHFEVDKIIKNYYYLPCQNLIKDNDDQILKWGWDRKTILSPYSIIICGAYFNRKLLYSQLLFLVNSRSSTSPLWTVVLNGKPIKYLEDLKPYFKEYSDGFEKGYKGFDEECIKRYLPLYSERSDYIFKVYEFVTKVRSIDHRWINPERGFTTHLKNRKTPGEITNAFEDGVAQGYFYKAWSIILSNSNLFSPLFQSSLELSVVPGESKNLSLKEVALKYFYEKRQVTRENGAQIAKEHGYTSGDALYNHYTYFSSTANRTGKPMPCTPTKLLNKIQMFEKIINQLPESKRGRAEDELKILKKIYDSEYQ